MNIREARINDIDSIEQLSPSLGYETPLSQIAQDRLSVVINSTSNKVWVAESDGEITGWIHAFLALRIASVSFVEIGGISVSSKNRRKGTGRELILKAQSWASEIGLALRVRCNTKREEAHDFYKNMGFIKGKEQYVFEICPCRDCGEKGKV